MSKDEGRFRFSSMDYLKRDGRERGQLLNRGFWWYHVPRLMLVCRLFGHKAVVAGGSARWVCCDRCGVRRNPQGHLDPQLWDVGDRFVDQNEYGENEQPPGPWLMRPTGTIGGQIVVGGQHSLSAELKVGNKGSENKLAVTASIPRVGFLSLNSGSHGTWFQRRLIPTEYESRKIGFSAHDGKVYWSLWEPRDSWSRDQPKWWGGSIPYDLRDVLWGPLSYSYEDVGDPVPVVVRMPYSDEDNHDVVLQLQRQRRGRKRGKPRDEGWIVKWDSKAGIPFRRDDGWKGGRTYGSSVKVSRAAVANGTWPLAAAAAIADHIMAQRVRYDFTPLQLEDELEPAMDLG